MFENYDNGGRQKYFEAKIGQKLIKREQIQS